MNDHAIRQIRAGRVHWGRHPWQRKAHAWFAAETEPQQWLPVYDTLSRPHYGINMSHVPSRFVKGEWHDGNLEPNAQPPTSECCKECLRAVDKART